MSLELKTLKQKTTNKKLTTLALLLFVLAASVCAQTNSEVTQAIAKLDSGNVAAVRQQLPGLVTKYQNDPGVLYLQGRLASNGNEARQYYQTIVTNFPKSDWADDALYRLYQYNYAMGLYRTANAELQQLAKDYPASPYVKKVAQAGLPKLDNPVTKPAVQPEPKKDDTPKITEQSKPPQPPAQEKFALQVGAFSTSANAEKLKDSFEQKGYRVEVANKVQNGKSLYKVWVGAYKTHEAAEKAAKEVKTKFGLSAIVVER